MSEKSPFLAEQLVQAEMAVLGSMLLDPDVVGNCLQLVTAEDFISSSYRLVFQAIRKLFNSGQDADTVTVNSALGGNYRKVLTDILENTPTAANWQAYAAQLRTVSAIYRIRELGENLANADSKEAVQALVEKINALSCGKPQVRITTLADCYQEFLDRHAAGRQPPYFTWGIPALDERIYVEPGDFIVLGGYPSAGKTAMALQMAYHIAGGKRVGYFYLENNEKKLFDRVLSARTLVSFGKIKRYDLDEADFSNIVAVQARLVEPLLEFVDASGMSVQDVRAVALSRRYDMVVVDYLQKLNGGAGRRNYSDFERVSEVSSDLQNLGRQTGITLLALSQLNRPEMLKDGKILAPGMHSFRQSGQIEQDADVALLLYKDDESTFNSTRTLKISKNKEGVALDILTMTFDGNTQTFRRVYEKTEEPREKQKPRQINFWDGWEATPDNDTENPF